MTRLLIYIYHLSYTETGSAKYDGGLMAARKCYEDSVTLPVVHTVSMTHGDWMRARMEESDSIALVLKRKSRKMTMLTRHCYLEYIWARNISQ